ncbi:hypothetical protein ABK040_016453 [Willaertia magna]
MPKARFSMVWRGLFASMLATLLIVMFYHYVLKTNTSELSNSNNLFSDLLVEDVKENNFANYTKFRYHSASVKWNRSIYLFENVCMNEKGEFIAYTTSDLYENFIKDIEGKPLSISQANALHSRRAEVRLRILQKSIPKSFVSSIKWFHQPIIVTKRFAVGRLENTLFDNMIPLNDVIDIFNFPLSSTSILFLDEIFYRDNVCKKRIRRGKGKKHKMCIEAVAHNGTSKGTAVAQSMEWVGKLTNVAPLQLCSSLISNPVVDNAQDYNSGRSKIIYSIEQAPCPRDNIWNEKKQQLSLMSDEEYKPIKRIKSDKTSSETAKQNEMKKVNENILACFKKIAIGTGERSLLMNGFGKTFSLISFRNTISKRFNIDFSNKQSKTLTIFLQSKDSFITNTIEVKKQLVEKLSKKYNKEIVFVEEKPNYNSLLETVNFVKKIDIFITTHRTDYFMALFAKDKSIWLTLPKCRPTIEPITTDIKNGFYCSSKNYNLLTIFSFIQTFSLEPAINHCEDFRDECKLSLDFNKILSRISMGLRNLKDKV